MPDRGDDETRRDEGRQTLECIVVLRGDEHRQPLCHERGERDRAELAADAEQTATSLAADDHERPGPRERRSEASDRGAAADVEDQVEAVPAARRTVPAV